MSNEMVKLSMRERLVEALIEVLIDQETGALSDTPYIRAEAESDQTLSLFESISTNAFPDASVDIPQMADAILPLLEAVKAEGWDEGYRARERSLETWFEPSADERMYWPDDVNPYRKESL